MDEISNFRKIWGSYLCSQNDTFSISFSIEKQKIHITDSRSYPNRQNLIDDALPMEPLRHLLQICLQNEANKRFIIIPVNYSHDKEPQRTASLLLIHHHATLEIPYVVRCELDSPALEEIFSMTKLDSMLLKFFSEFNYKYVKATYPSAMKKELQQWLQSGKGTKRPYGSDDYRTIYANVMDKIVAANTFALLTYQFSSLSISWQNCEKWLLKQNSLEKLETLNNALGMLKYTDSSATQIMLENLMAEYTSCQARCKETSDATEQTQLIADLQNKLDVALGLIEKQNTETKMMEMPSSRSRLRKR